MQQLSEFVINNLLLFAALLAVLIMLIKAELDHQANKGLQLSPAMAIRLMNNNDEALILDVRPEADYKKGHIKGAKNIQVSSLGKDIDKYSGFKKSPILVYCNSGSSVVAAIKILKKAGFEQINNLDGGISAWKEANMPLSKK